MMQFVFPLIAGMQGMILAIILIFEIGKILSAHCNSNAKINKAYFIIDLDSFYAISNFEIIQKFSKEHDLIAKIMKSLTNS